MIETLLLMLISMIVGGVIVSHDGLKGLSIGLIAIFLAVAFYGGILGLFIGVIGILAILLFWLYLNKNKSFSRLYSHNSKSNNSNIRKNSRDSLADHLRNNLQKGLKE